MFGDIKDVKNISLNSNETLHVPEGEIWVVKSYFHVSIRGRHGFGRENGIELNGTFVNGQTINRDDWINEQNFGDDYGNYTEFYAKSEDEIEFTVRDDDLTIDDDDCNLSVIVMEEDN